MEHYPNFEAETPQKAQEQNEKNYISRKKIEIYKMYRKGEIDDTEYNEFNTLLDSNANFAINWLEQNN